MKSWRLFWICTVLVGHNAICRPYVSIFDGYGKVTVSESSSGLKTAMNLQVEPKQKYMIKYLSSCRATSPYLTQFRHSFEIITTSDKQGKIQQSSYFLGMRMVDLKSRSPQYSSTLPTREVSLENVEMCCNLGVSI